MQQQAAGRHGVCNNTRCLQRNAQWHMTVSPAEGVAPVPLFVITLWNWVPASCNAMQWRGGSSSKGEDGGGVWWLWQMTGIAKHTGMECDNTHLHCLDALAGSLVLLPVGHLVVTEIHTYRTVGCGWTHSTLQHWAAPQRTGHSR